MKKIIYLFVILMTLMSCGNQQTTIAETENQEIPFVVVRNYFFKNGNEIPSTPSITTQEEFNRLFGMATTMGKDGKPTSIDFNKQFVLAVILPVTDMETEITPVKVETHDESLICTYEVKEGKKQSFSIQPLSIIILDRKYVDMKVETKVIKNI